jgi:hypothetical protein
MANVKNPLQLVETFFFVVEVGVFPVQRMPGRGLQVAFGCHVVSPRLCGFFVGF